MATKIHPSTIVNNSVHLGENVQIGAYSVLEGPIRIDDYTEIGSHVRISGDVSIGQDNLISPYCCIGENAQNWDVARRKDICSGIRIGTGNIFREFVTLHRSSQNGCYTIVGNNNRIMVGVHIAHDCTIGNNITIVNMTQIAGGVIISDHAYISGNCKINSFIKIGMGAFIDATALVLHDIPPFFSFSRKEKLYKVRIDGIRSTGFDKSDIKRYQEIHKKLHCGETWKSIYCILSKDEGSIDALLREFLRRSTSGLPIVS